jgi:hypothetical protein
MTRRHRSGWSALALTIALVVSACGVPTNDEARTLGTPPFGLDTTAAPAATTTTVPPEDGFRLVLYWVGQGDVLVPGEPTGLAEAPTFQTVIDLLVFGPASTSGTGPTETTTTTAAGDTTVSPALRTYVSESLHPDWAPTDAPGPVVAAVDENTLIVDVRVADDIATAPGFRLAVAQIVCTITQFDNASGVRFFDSSGQLNLSTIEGVPLDGDPATRENIGTCDPPTPDPTTTTTSVQTRARPSTTRPSAPLADAAGP